MIPPNDNFPSITSIRNRKGFSLIEVTLAIGVISFALLALLGVMPVGMATLRDAMDRTTESQIIRQIGATALLTSYTNLPTQFSGTTFYYDQEGTLLGQSPAGRPEGTRYSAQATLQSPNFPGSSTATNITASLWSVHIALKTGPSASTASTNHYNIQIPNSGS
jgi:uncharacterized protein (TIGR02598 family)